MASPIDDGVTAEDLGHVLFIGVGGVGLSGLARLYATRGLPVTGSELHDWPSLKDLAALGVTIHREHAVSNLDGIDTVVRSTVHPDDHLELVEARGRGLRIMHRSEALAAAMTGKKSIVVTGTHGKSTTTAMIIDMLNHCGLDPSFVNGAESVADGRSGAHGSGEYFIAEADESDRSFLRYRPHIAVLTNVDVDHLNTYGTMEALEDGFADFLRGTDADGAIIACADDARAAALARRMRDEGREVLTYGTAADADLVLRDFATDTRGVGYSATYRGRDLGEFRVGVPGTHLGLNSAAALLTGLRMGIDAEELRKGLAAFAGLRRRFELTGTEAGVRVYDEYAYHPTAIKAAMSTLKELAAPGRLLVVFQPYRVYRTRDLRAEIAEGLAIGDEAVVMEVFGPGEELPPGDGGVALCEAIGLDADHKHFIPEWSDVPAAVKRLAGPGDVVVTMGAPPISLMHVDILNALRQ
ncbi:MAG TPA: UDP-N-acetylmuramate--L-alanine ligase [Stackebrandtia sp.]|jgi:UDP-N-acetylmuramate--alanine ligase|uniref:UDP-N-acetylmuramate--L-alanine ligase n=1 Tax=Stackebrandtia sp. TaxID=2023065 RepID=UPI002D44DDEF|nr:UDP-N-acetylmuramate--L-alanine ligase [Stackebrandtia sp.]HZE38150.1 UDP-N-acetylmuramate--L-alanine ligase [Stackebrandtia sp.]